MLNRNTLVRSAAILLVALQSVASYGYTQANDVDKCVEVHTDQTVARATDITEQIQAQTEVALVRLNTDARARLATHIRESTRELLTAATPSDAPASKPLRMASASSE